MTAESLAETVAVARREDLVALSRLHKPDAELLCGGCGTRLPPTVPAPGLFPLDADAGDPPAARREAAAWFGAGLSWGIAAVDRVIAALRGETDPHRLTIRELNPRG